MKILFITRKFPPSVGGMETHAHELYQELTKRHEVDLIKWGGSNKLLPIVYPWMLLKAVVHAWGRQPAPDVIYLQDGIMAPLGWVVKALSRRPSIVTVHGLDITFKNPVFQAMVPRFIAKQTAIVAVSEGTKQEVLSRLPKSSVTVVANGVKDVFKSDATKQELLEQAAQGTGLSLEQLQQSKILLTTGRLVKRKGVAWFVSAVLPDLVAADPKILYLVCGVGKQQSAIEQAVERHGLQANVKLLGRVSDELIRTLYNASDVFVMPNIPTPGNVEGFGLVALEAASCGTVVVASDLEGISDAIKNDENGFLVPAKDAAAWRTKLLQVIAEPGLSKEAIRNYTLTNYSWQKTAEGYEKVFDSVLS